MEENVLPVLSTVDSATDRLSSCPSESGNMALITTMATKMKISLDIFKSVDKKIYCRCVVNVALPFKVFLIIPLFDQQ